MVIGHIMGRRWAAIGTTTAIAVAALVAPATSQAAATKVTRCRLAQLSVKVTSAGAGLGHEGVRLHFRNRADVRCSLRGYPGVAGLKHGRQVEQAKRTRFGYLGGLKPGQPIPTVILRPGQVGTALLEGTDVPPHQPKPCRELSAILITPPNDRASVRSTVTPPDCSRIEVHPVLRGKTGTDVS